MKSLVIVFFLSPLLQGCGLGILLAGSGASKAGSAQMMSAYTDYTISMEKLNLEREQAGLSPRPIMTKREWLRGTGKEESPAEDENRREERSKNIVN